MSYSELSVEERAIIPLSQAQGYSLRGMRTKLALVPIAGEASMIE